MAVAVVSLYNVGWKVNEEMLNYFRNNSNGWQRESAHNLVLLSIVAEISCIYSLQRE